MLTAVVQIMSSDTVTYSKELLNEFETGIFFSLTSNFLRSVVTLRRPSDVKKHFPASQTDFKNRNKTKSIPKQFSEVQTFNDIQN